MNWVNIVKEGLPDYAKDTKLNLDAVLLRSSLDPLLAQGCALAAAFAAGNSRLATAIDAEFEDRKEADAALTAAAIMAQNNVWYPYVEMAEDPALKGLPAQLRMNGIMNHGGTSKVNFEAYSLAASIVGKCHFCVKAHYDTLKKEGLTVEQLRDVGRIAAVINSVAKVLSG
jgi:lipoyl-dependent peroxiredoxin subunit D